MTTDLDVAKALGFGDWRVVPRKDLESLKLG